MDLPALGRSRGPYLGVQKNKRTNKIKQVGWKV
jgi:hypothetical protein